MKHAEQPVPVHIKRDTPYMLAVEWTDGARHVISLRTLRDACPCAHCTGEEILGEKVFQGLHTISPGMYLLSTLNPVGNYGIRATWKDGHDSGIFTWELLRKLCLESALNEEQIQEIRDRMEHQ